MLALLLVLGSAAPSATHDLNTILQSPRLTLNLYRNFKVSQSLSYNGQEDASRFRLFRENAKLVARLNSNPTEEATYALNFFATLTEEEKSMYKGLNVTGHGPNLPPLPGAAPKDIPESVLWVNEELVTPVQEQVR